MTDAAIGITGANGYVGRVIVDAVRRAGWEPVGLSSTAGPGQRAYRLGQPVPARTVAGLSAVVHAAHDFSTPASETRHRNTAGSRPLLEAAADAGVPVVLVSTLAAFDGCRSAYGRAKLALEELVLGAGGRVLRAGLVWGEGDGGIVASLQHAVGALPLVPVFAPHSATYVTEAGALGRLAVHLATGTDRAGADRPVLAAADDAMSFAAVIRILAAAQDRSVRLVPIPVPWGLGALRLGELLRLPLPFRSDSLLALAHPVPADQVARLDRSPVPFPPLTGQP